MTIRERPLINAVSNLGPLPGYLFAGPFVSGFVAMLMTPVFGAAAAGFIAAGHGEADSLRLFEIARFGGFVVMVLAALLIFGIGVSGIFNREERPARLGFALGAATGTTLLVVADALTIELARSWLETAGPIV